MRKLLRLIALLMIPVLVLSGNSLLSYALTVEGLNEPDGERWQQVEWPGENESTMLINLFNGVNVIFGEDDLVHEQDPVTYMCSVEKNYIFLNGATGSGDFTNMDNANIYADSSSTLTDTAGSQDEPLFNFNLSGNTSYATILQDVSGAENLSIGALFALTNNDETADHVFGMGVVYSERQIYESYWPEPNEHMIEVNYDGAGVNVSIAATNVSGPVLAHPEGWGQKAKVTGPVAVTFQVEQGWEFDGLRLDETEYSVDALTADNFSDDRVNSINLETGTVTFNVLSDYMHVDVLAHDPNGDPGHDPAFDSKYSVMYDHRPEGNNPTAFVWAGDTSGSPLSWQGTRYDFTSGNAITFTLQKPSDDRYENETPVVELRELMDDHSDRTLSTYTENNEDQITLTPDPGNILRYSFTYTPDEHVGAFDVYVYWSEYDRVRPNENQICIEANLDRTTFELENASADPIVISRSSSGNQTKFIYPIADKTKYALFTPDQGCELNEVRINNTSYALADLTEGTQAGTYKIQLSADMFDDRGFMWIEARSVGNNGGGGDPNDPNGQNPPGPHTQTSFTAVKAFDYVGAKQAIEGLDYAFSFNDTETTKQYFAKQLWHMFFGFLPRKGHAGEFEGMYGKTLANNDSQTFNFDDSEEARNRDDKLVFMLSSDVGDLPHARIFLSNAEGYSSVTTIGQTDMGYIDAEVGLISGTDDKYAFSFSPKSSAPFDVKIYWTDSEYDALTEVTEYTPLASGDNNFKTLISEAPAEKNVSVSVSSYLCGMDELKANITVTGPVSDTRAAYGGGYLDCYNYSVTLPDNSVASGKIFKLTQVKQGIVRFTKNGVNTYQVFDIPERDGLNTDVLVKGDHDPEGMYPFGNGVGIEGFITNGYHMGQGASDMEEDATIGGLNFRMSVFQGSDMAVKVNAELTAAPWDFANTGIYEIGSTEYHAEVFYGNNSLTIKAANFGDGAVIESVSVDTSKLSASAASISSDGNGTFTVTFNSGYDSIPLLIKFVGDETIYKETIDRLGINADWASLGDIRGYNGLNIWHGTDHSVYYDASCFDNQEAAVFATFYYDSPEEPVNRVNLHARITFKDGTVINKNITESITTLGTPVHNGNPADPALGGGLQGDAQYYDDFVVYACSRADIDKIDNITFFAYEKSNDPSRFGGAKVGSGDGYYWKTGQ